MKTIEVVKLSCFLISLACLSKVTNAIECYECNSRYDPGCADPFDPYSLGKVNCSLKSLLDHLPDKEPVLCRKTTQKIFGKIHVIRGCGYLKAETDDNPGCLKKSGTFEVQSYFCSCTNDLCNAAPMLHRSIANVIGALIVVFILCRI